MSALAIKIKSLGEPPAGAHWSYGRDYMRRISEGAARQLLRPHALPRMGFEAVASAGGISAPRLYVQNIGGDFYAACCAQPISEWARLFGVEVQQ